MTSLWMANPDTPVDTDGVLGPLTVKALQYGLGVTADGELGPVTVEALQTNLDVAADGEVGPVTTVALQRRINSVGNPSVTVDGQWGAQTTRALQQVLNAGTFGGPPPVTAPTAPAGNPQDAIGEADVQYYRGQSVSDLGSVVSQAATFAQVPQSWVSPMENIIIPHESAGDPNAVNNYDSNATGADQSDGYPQNCSRGLAQTIPSTFAGNHAAGTSNNIYDPVANVAAAFIYIVRTYDQIENVPGVKAVNEGGSYVGY